MVSNPTGRSQDSMVNWRNKIGGRLHNSMSSARLGELYQHGSPGTKVTGDKMKCIGTERNTIAI